VQNTYFSPERKYNFAIQAAVEAFMTLFIVEMLQAKLPGWTVEALQSQAEQKLGDLRLVTPDGTEIFIELKNERYAGTLFIETTQFSRTEGFLRFYPSWGFTTTAHLMLYFSGRTGQLLLAPRDAWLAAGLRLKELSMLTSVEGQGGAVRPWQTLNGDGVLERSAAGLGMRTTDWLALFARMGGAVHELVLADGMPLLQRIRNEVSKDPVAALRKTKYGTTRNRDDILMELKDWAAGAPPTREEAEARDDLLAELARLRKVGVPAYDSLDAVGGLLAAPATAQLSREPLIASMHFHVTADVLCSNASRKKAALKYQAQHSPVKLWAYKLSPFRASRIDPTPWKQITRVSFPPETEGRAPPPSRDRLFALLDKSEAELAQLRAQYLARFTNPLAPGPVVMPPSAL
jgi:hypothetical protein